MKIGLDIDGVITPLSLINPTLKLPQFLYLFLFPFFLLIPPRPKIRSQLVKISLKHEILIISARPPFSKNLTEKWLRFHRIPYNKVYCVGFGEGTRNRKLMIVKKEKIELFIDDDPKFKFNSA